ncbi:multidrug effflux MFS transporter [Corynebacterium uterequi]|uniref:Drug resistance transporter, Bcr/CflA subfamily n=1 Tax=Corynebacterium uterequi TaxID=1072256 RepID=A0A0G3HFE6_9CORY|nr:multidrug effflux MFS transporter [Corynebacterium uterequi]AKK12076.1 drug resistance transporter, Bcr/CflA subfamily [Corynebacterium uterequi]
MATPTTPPTGLPRRLLVVLAFVSMVSPLSINMYLSGLPMLVSDFHATQTAGQLTLTAFLVGIGVGQFVVGPLSDSMGRRRLLLLGTAGLVLTAAVAALAGSLWVIYAARVLQGLSAGAAVVLARAIAGDLVRGEGLAKVFSMLMLLGAVAPVLGPIAGGFIVDASGWRTVFWVLSTLAVLMCLAVALVVPESLAPDARRPFALASLREGFAALAADRQFMGYCVGFIFTFSTMFAYVSASPFVLQQTYGFSQIQFSHIFAINTAGMFVLTLVNRVIVGKVGPRVIVRVGNLVQLVATFYLVVVTVADAGRMWTLAGLFVVVATTGINSGNASALAISRAGALPVNVTGTASAILGAGQFLVAGIISPAVGALGASGVAQPVAMAAVMCAMCATASVGIHFVAAPRRRRRAAGVRRG